MPTATKTSAARLEALRQAHPEWSGWLALLAETLRALHDPAWNIAVPQLPAAQAPDVPALDRLTLTVDERLASEFLQRLLHSAAKSSPEATDLLGGRGVAQLEALALLEAAICQDDERLSDLADAAEADLPALKSVAALAVMPLLHACRRQLAEQVSPTWQRGTCPICGGWPTLAELRGLERERHLRCARCGGDWLLPTLHCPFCDTTNHRQLGMLLPETNSEMQRVETCTQCKGYLKTVTTLAPWPADGILLEDLATVTLDVAALQRGYTRPTQPATRLHLRLLKPERRGWLKRH